MERSGKAQGWFRKDSEVALAELWGNSERTLGGALGALETPGVVSIVVDLHKTKTIIRIVHDMQKENGGRTSRKHRTFFRPFLGIFSTPHATLHLDLFLTFDWVLQKPLLQQPPPLRI